MPDTDIYFMAIKEILAENVREYRNTNNLSQEQLAEISGLHRTYIGSVERKERNVTLSTLIFLSKAMNVSVPDLLTKQESKNEQG
ncbi:helix-turn-helix domain-containing protein [Escherichia coli]|uniref:helix-turn-helix domain-containing protein n=1 Tax=Escherichia coli TaxID=562 RepID=UPI002378687D|nr:helix-turn-helix transcriptional regulator [Escherichia coli]MCA7561674.1 helix-turn-helix domain-containing protein [Escherichia coli]MDD8160655.1 helix-turn-helix domain-containing protein [Escherichia coli]MDJ8152597.1 helix-turn-helix domain-containing protein [Salmonella enterica]MDU9640281.1 helix-turn-helix domain-containing protein [Escherichia coli]